MENTIVAVTLNARDWEALIDLMDNSAIRGYRIMKADLIAFYKAANPKPPAGTNITLNIKHKFLYDLFAHLYGGTVEDLVNDAGTQPNDNGPFKKITAAIRTIAAAAKVAVPSDPYLADLIQVKDDFRALKQRNKQKNGREILLMDDYDNN